jgi:hypothetical protein
MIIAVALLAIAMGVLRFVLLVYDFFGAEFLFFVALSAAVYLYIPAVVIVEFLFFVVYFWRRRKRADRRHMPPANATPVFRISGQAERVWVKK